MKEEKVALVLLCIRAKHPEVVGPCSVELVPIFFIAFLFYVSVESKRIQYVFKLWEIYFKISFN